MKCILAACIIGFRFLCAQNSLIIFTEEGQPFSLILNDQKHNEKPQTNVKVPGLDQASCKVKVVFEDPLIVPVESVIYLMMDGKNVVGKEFTYSVSRNKKGKLYIKFISCHPMAVVPDPLVPLEPVAFTSQVTNTRVFGNVYDTYKGYPTFKNNLPAVGSCTSALIESDLQIACELIEQSFKGEEKLKSAEAIVKNNCVNSAQVIQMAKLISFEIDRLKFVKSAFANLTDKEKAHNVADALSFNPSKEEYLKFIKGNTGNKTILCKTAMPDTLFEAVLSNLKSKHHDIDKSSMARQCIAGNCLSSEQVRQILQQFNYDDARLEIAKEAYSKTTDRNNYNIVHSAFSKGAATEELTNFVNRQE